MTRITPKLRRLDLPNGTQQWFFFCPGCRCAHFFETPRWKFDGNAEAPTFAPSLRMFYWATCDDGKIVEPRKRVTTCHLFVAKGKLQFCADCPHELASKNVDMIEFPDNYQCD